MESIQIMMWAIGGGFAGTWIMMGWVLSSLNNISVEIKDLRKDVQGVDVRVARLEGAFSSKDFCILKHEHKEKAS